MEQRVTDFQALAGLYARHYAPANWKIVGLGVNIFDTEPWLRRVRAAKDDLEFYEICGEYVASLKDGHSVFLSPSNFYTTMGVLFDIFDGKVLVTGVSRWRFPGDEFDFDIGDELISLDGKPALELAAELTKTYSAGIGRATLRQGALFLGFRSQDVIPRATETPEVSLAVIRSRETGEVQTFSLPWRRFGDPLIVSRLPNAARHSEPAAEPLRARHEYAVTSRVPLRHAPAVRREFDAELPANALLDVGGRSPYFDMPAGFVRRRGIGSDNLFSGTFVAEGYRLGYIRIPTFDQPLYEPVLRAVREFDAEIRFLQENTDGLILDVTRNPGGWCSADYVARLTPQPFLTYQSQFLPSISELNVWRGVREEAAASGAPDWVLRTYDFLVDSLLGASQGVRALTGPLPECDQFAVPGIVAPTELQYPATDSLGRTVAYTKPVVVLVDDLSFSQAEHFAAMLQDNQRALIVGTRTPGLGGGVRSFENVTPFTEASASATIRLTVRSANHSAPGLPSSPFLENTGVIPDVAIDSQTSDNLLQRGRTYIDSVVRTTVDYLRRKM